MDKIFERSELIYGKDKIEALKNKKVLVFGLGGVGGHAVEGLARTGIGHFTLVDNDKVSESNINRQIIALHSTVGKYKTEVMKQRILDINPSCEVETKNIFFLPENQNEIDFTKYDYVVDAIDTISAKIALAQICSNLNIPLISSMGTGNKIDPTKFEVCDIYKTVNCPLAKVMRHELKKRGIKKLKVVYSKELPLTPKQIIVNDESKKVTPGSVSFVPSVAGLIIASVVINELVK